MSFNLNNGIYSVISFLERKGFDNIPRDMESYNLYLENLKLTEPKLYRELINFLIYVQKC